jgi:flavin-dependent dehydrogenase
VVGIIDRNGGFARGSGPMVRNVIDFGGAPASGGLADPGTWGDGNPITAGDESRSQASGTERLHDGSRVAVIGGGPAGSLFSHFLLKTLSMAGVHIELDIFEPRLFTHSGPSGCNHCGGVVSESLVQILATEGISLPPDVVQRAIDSYQMHMDVGQVRIATPLQEKRIAAVYRGNGPRQAPARMIAGFDRYLLDMAVARGANWRRQLVGGVRRAESGWQIDCVDGAAGDYDLVVVACGINSALLPLAGSAAKGYRPPTPLRTFIAEFRLGRTVIESSLGTSMHVFLLDIPGLQFAAIIPKGDYATLCMLGANVDDEMINAFLNSREVRDVFPESRVPANVCHCLASINVAPARQPFDDGIVFIGDSGVARLYKDGIGSAYRTAKAAASTCALRGIGAEDFAAGYLPTCRALERDNKIGRLIFGVCHLIQKLRFTRRAVLRMVQREQSSPDVKPMMSSVLWDVFTGSAPYSSVLLRTMHPVFLGRLLWNLAIANLPGAGKSTQEVTAI